MDLVTISRIRSRRAQPSFEMRLPTLVSLKEFIPQARGGLHPVNVFLRDRFCCSIGGRASAHARTTFDHLVPRRAADAPAGENVVTGVPVYWHL